jgi:tRNA1(Val) A37 N6-methylase TrmN6
VDYTIDSIWSPKIRIRQPAKGYRFALDAVLLAHFLRCDENEEVMEVGCGSGVIAVMLSHLQRYRKFTAVEIQPELAQLARENFADNNVPNAGVLEADIRSVSGPAVDLLYSNPPYRKAGEGRLNPQEQKAIARHEIRMTLEDLFAAARRLLKPAGRLSVILPEFRKQDFRALTGKNKYHFRELQEVHSFAAEPPAFFLATISPAPGPFEEYTRLVIYKSHGKYTEEMAELLTAPASLS